MVVNKIPLYRFYLKFSTSDTHMSLKGYLIGNVPPKMNIHLIAYKETIVCLKISIFENLTFTFVSTLSNASKILFTTIIF
jgi:hypothetical protein